MLEVSDSQLRYLRQSRKAHFYKKMSLHLSALAPNHIEAMAEKNLSDFIQTSIACAEHYNIYQQNTVQLWLELSMLFGIGFAEDPSYAFITSILHKDEPELIRMRAVQRAVIAYQNSVYGLNAIHFQTMLQKLDTLCSSGEDILNSSDFMSPSQLLEFLWPERVQYIHQIDLEALIEVGDTLAEEYHQTRHQFRLLFSVMVFLLGAKVQIDPQYRWFFSVLKKDESVSDSEQFTALWSKGRAYAKVALRTHA